MNIQIHLINAKRCLALLAAIGLAACGGGGSSAVATLGGTALTGAALASAKVTVIDGTGKECATATSDAAGKWSTALGDCGAAPYLVKTSGTNAAGESVSFVSVATGTDVTAKTNVNVSQITDAIVKLALRSDAPASGDLANATEDKLKDASAQLIKNLFPDDVLDDSKVDSTVDLRTAAVTAGSGSGVDKLHDRIPETKVVKNGANLELVAKVDGYKDKDGNPVSATVGATVPASAATGTVITPADKAAGVETKKKADTTPTVMATLTPEQAAKGAIMLMLGKWDAVYASAVPNEAATALQFSDACYLDDGKNLAYLKDAWTNDNANVRADNQYRVGATRTNLNIKSLTPSADKKTVEATVAYDIAYKDGTTAKQAVNKLVVGDSKPLCTARDITGAAQSSTQWRFAGNGRQVATNVQAVNALYKPYKLSDGSSNGADYRRNMIEFQVQDFAGKNINYVIITGPSLPLTGVKMMLPVAVRDGVEFGANKTGKYLNYTYKDGARYCSAYTTVNGVANTQVWDAHLADCTANGVSGNGWWGDDAWLDAKFPNGGTTPIYTFKLYADDGWKTVNGHSSKTPVYTYTDELTARPFKLSELASSNFPTVDTLDAVQTSTLLGLIKDTGGAFTFATVNPTTTPAASTNAFAFQQTWAYSQGAAATNAANVSYPKYRQIAKQYPLGQTVLSNYRVNLLGKMTEMRAVDYWEGVIQTTDRNGRYIRTYYTYGN